QFDHLSRRDFITLLGGAAVAWPLAARAQQRMPAVGFLNSQSPEGYAEQGRGFRQGLKDGGHVRGGNPTVENRWANNQVERLPALPAELVGRRVAVIAANGPSALAAKLANHDDTDCLPQRERSGPARPCRQHEPTRRPRHWGELLGH